MTLPRRMIIRIAIFLFFCSGTSQAQLMQLQTDNLQLIYYSQAHDYVIPHIARCFENAYRFHQNVFDYNSKEKITVFVEDFGDFGNAGAVAIPQNFVKIGISPFNYIYGTMPANERMNWVMNHELVHIVTTDKPLSGSDRFFRKIFGGKVYPDAGDPLSMFYSYFTNPRVFTPRWYREGIAVFMETWMAGGLGRALNGYDEMVFRTMVRDGNYIYHLVGLEAEGTAINFQVGVNAYLYGTRFMTFLAHEHGPEKLVDWVSGSQKGLEGYAGHFKKVYSRSLNDEWSAWIEWEKNWQQENLEAVRKHPVTSFQPITADPLGSVSRMYYNKASRELLAAIRYPGKLAEIVAINVDTGNSRSITKLTGAALFYVTSLAFDEESGTLFYTVDNHDWRDLKAVDINTGKSRKLMKDFRSGDMVVNPVDKSLWAVRHYLGISTIVRIPPPYNDWKQVYSYPYGKDIFDIDISPDGKKLVGVVADIGGRQQLVTVDTDTLLSGKHNPELVYDFEFSYPSNFVFSNDGESLYGSSYYSGVSNIYRYDFANKDINILSNTETGLFRPLPLGEDSIATIRYTGNGFHPVLIPDQIPEKVGAIKFLGNAVVEKHPVVKDWKISSPADVNLDSLGLKSIDYSALGNLRLNSIYPIVQGYKDYPAYGLRLDLSDRLGVLGLDLKGSYSPNTLLPDDERFHASARLHYWNWEFSASYNPANFYDLFGPTKSSRKGFIFSGDYAKELYSESPRSLQLYVNASAFVDLDRLPYFQNVATPVNEFFTFGATLDYSFLQASLGAVGAERGWGAGFSSYSYYANSKLFPHLMLDGFYGFLLPIPHSSIWMRGYLGVSDGDRDIAFANAYFGGFGNNWVDRGSLRRYRSTYSFPGVDLNSIEGQNYGKFLMEWSLPPVRFRKMGTSMLYLNWSRLSLFGSAIATDIHNSDRRRNFASLGGQLDFRLMFFSALQATFSLGYAIAVEKDYRPGDEFMISLKIL